MRLSVFKVSPEAYSENTYQLAYIVKSLRPNSVLEGRKLVDGPIGQVSIGQANKTDSYFPTSSSGNGPVLLNMLAMNPAEQCLFIEIHLCLEI